MNKICIGKEKFTSVSKDDYESLSKFKWCESKNGYTSYVMRSGIVDGKKKTIYMHRQILGILNSKIESDHIDGDGLNNTRENLRTCTRQDNLRNRISNNSLSSFKGVEKQPCKKNPWRAVIVVNRKTIYLGAFKTTKEAALAYNQAAPLYHGEFARLNDVS